MGIIELFVRRRVLTTVLVLIAVILGAVSYGKLGLRRFPNIDFPFATITTVLPGASPTEMERDVTKRIEDAVSSISGIDEMTSYSQQGLSLVLLQFNLEEDIDIKATDISNKLDLIRRDLPDAAEDPVVAKFDISQSPVMQLALSGPQGTGELYRVADEDLSTFISQVPGVASVELTGGERREIQVLLDASKLRKFRVPIGLVISALAAANMDVPGGHITQPGREFVVRATGRFENVGDITGVRIPTAGRGTLTVGDLGRVVDTYGEERTVSRFDGQPAIILTIQAETDANEVEVADAVKARMDQWRKLLPAGTTLTIANDDTEFVRGSLANVRSNMLIGILLTAAALFLFLKSGRATLVISLVMPTAIISTFTFMFFSGFTLNILSLTGLAIVVGVLVNNAILIVENVYGFIHRGEEPQQAAVLGAKDIALAIFSSTATNLVVFLPLAFMGEIIGRFFRELGLTVVYATVVSLLVSFTLTPMMCGLLLRGQEEEPGPVGRFMGFLFGWTADLWMAAFGRLKGLYLSMLSWCLRWRWTTVALTAGIAVASVGVFAAVGMEFQPSMDEGRFVVTVQAPVGTPLSETDRAVRQIEAALKTLPHMEHYAVRVGNISGFLGGSSEGVNLAEISVTVADRAEREQSLDDLVNALSPQLADVPGVQIAVSKSGGGPGGAPVMIDVLGDNLDDLRAVADRVVRIVESVPGTSGVGKSYQTGQPEMHIIPIQDAVNRYKVDRGSVSSEVRSYVEGDVATQFRDRGENYDVRVKLREKDRDWVEDVQRMFVSTPNGREKVRVGQLADLRMEAGPTLITRKDRRRQITVSAQLTGERPFGKVKDEIQSRIDQDIALPQGVSVEWTGEAEFMQKNFAELGKAMAIGAVLTYLCVAGIIESFSFAVVIIMALPVCLIGVALAMLIGNVTVNMFSLMAMVILIGMVVNNAIIVIDYASRPEHASRPAREVIFEACERRFRMIVMANLTTVVALIPLSLGLGFGGEIFRPLAVVQMGGVTAAAVLSLLVIPVVYVMTHRKKG